MDRMMVAAWWDIVLERLKNGETIEPLSIASSYSLMDLIIAAEETDGKGKRK